MKNKKGFNGSSETQQAQSECALIVEKLKTESILLKLFYLVLYGLSEKESNEESKQNTDNQILLNFPCNSDLIAFLNANDGQTRSLLADKLTNMITFSNNNNKTINIYQFLLQVIDLMSSLENETQEDKYYFKF